MSGQTEAVRVEPCERFGFAVSFEHYREVVELPPVRRLAVVSDASWSSMPPAVTIRVTAGFSPTRVVAVDQPTVTAMRWTALLA